MNVDKFELLATTEKNAKTLYRISLSLRCIGSSKFLSKKE
jgi:hypothetical protein